MNYLLIHVGSIPKHFISCVSQIKTIDRNAKIYIAVDEDIALEDVNIFNLKDISSERTLFVSKMNIFSTEKNKLWITSLIRLFYLYDLARHAGLKQFVHFDNDVLIFKDFKEIEDEFDNIKFNITPLTNDQLIFGYSYIPNLEIYDEILDKIVDYLDSFSKDYLQNIKSKELNEMKLLHLIYEKNKNLFNLLNIKPGKSKYIFDPASYGQYLTGTKDKFTKKFIDERHLVGKEISSKKIFPYFHKKKPFVKTSSKNYELINLHIHSKKLNKYKS